MPDGMSYRDAGVDIDAGNALVERIKPAVKRTRRPEVLSGLGGFGALFQIDLARWREPLLVSGTDGVGTKLLLARQLGRHDTIGIDLVAMCVNDILTSGAEPQFFLDYYATGKLDIEVAETVVNGIADGCIQAGCALIGGETAEMPGMYPQGDYDLAGFAVGIVEKQEVIDGSAIQPGHRVLGLASSGPHSNGYSLIRRVLEHSGENPADSLPGAKGGAIDLGSALLAPTRIYVKAVLELIRRGGVHGLAHITGGGLTENIVRILPEGMGLRLDPQAWERPAVFSWLQSRGAIEETEMLRTFNCGIGMAVIVPADRAREVAESAEALGETCFEIGQITAHASGPRVAYQPSP